MYTTVKCLANHVIQTNPFKLERAGERERDRARDRERQRQREISNSHR